MRYELGDGLEWRGAYRAARAHPRTNSAIISFIILVQPGRDCHDYHADVPSCIIATCA